MGYDDKGFLNAPPAGVTESASAWKHRRRPRPRPGRHPGSVGGPKDGLRSPAGRLLSEKDAAGQAAR